MPHTLLPDRAVLSISGDDRFSFLQGLVTNNLRHVEEGRAIYSVLLTPQGKFLHDFFLIADGDAILMDIAASSVSDLLRRLTMYRLRAKVGFEQRSGWAVAVSWHETIEAPISFTDLRHSALGERYLGPREQFANFPEAPDQYDLHRLQLGIPEGGKDLIFDKSLGLLEFGIDKLHGIDFTKGCYVGQEVTARTKHRATLRKMIHQVTAKSNLPAAGTKVMADEREIGELRSSQGTIGLALLNMEELEKATAPLMADGVKIITVLPDWNK